MILSRVADALYWMGRYVERAENATRLLLVTDDLATEMLGLDEDLARAEWEHLAQIFPGAEPGHALRPTALAVSALRELALSPRHPNSVYSSVKRARDNARTVREALTVEVFVNLNETYRDLESYGRRKITDAPTFRAALADAQRGILATLGAIEHTLTRDPGWRFLKLGQSLEWAFRAATILRVKLPALIQPEPKLDLPLLHTRWRGLLRGLASLEHYRRFAGARVEPLDVLHFVLFNPDAPRSLHHGIATVKDHLDRLSNGGAPSAPARVMGRLAATLAYQSEEIIGRGDYVPFLDQVLGDVAKAHDAISALYFGM